MTGVAGGPVVRHLGPWNALFPAVLLVLGVLTPQPAAADAAFRRWIEDLWPEAAALGVAREVFDQAFANLEPDRKLPDLAPTGSAAAANPKSGQAEFVKSPASYLAERTLANLAKAGAAKAKDWRQPLAAIEQHYGVDGSVILAIWGRETVFGTHPLTHNAVRVLASQAYLGRRKAYFRNELLWALKIAGDGHITLPAMKSSWAGAMGLTQFMPTNFRDYAVDFDGDGRRDIWSSIPDSLASTANSLRTLKKTDDGDMAWVPGAPWGYEVRKPERFDCTLQGLDKMRPLRDWAQLGYTRAHGRPWIKERLDEPAFLMLPEGTRGPAFLLTHNFLVIKTYNFADLYALFVGHLADRIAGGGPFENPWVTGPPMREKDVLVLQKHLVAKGYTVGKVDGKIGWRTRVAIGLYEKEQGLDVDCYPTADDIAAVRAAG